MKRNILLLTTCIITFIISGCDKEEIINKEEPTIGKTISIDVTKSWDLWNYFSFSEDKIVGIGKANNEDDTIWKNRKDWDIAFTRLYARTNSGVSGNGMGGVIEIAPNNDDKYKNFAELTKAPNKGYYEDIIAKGDKYKVRDYGEGLLTSMPPKELMKAGTCDIINSWLTINPKEMKVTATKKVFVIRTNDGKYAKIYLKDYQNKDGQNGHITMEYIYQPDGSPNFN